MNILHIISLLMNLAALFCQKLGVAEGKTQVDISVLFPIHKLYYFNCLGFNSGFIMVIVDYFLWNISLWNGGKGTINRISFLFVILLISFKFPFRHLTLS